MNTRFYNHPNFSCADFANVYSVCYDLLYNDVVPESDRLYANGRTMADSNEEFTNKFNQYRGDCLISDREFMAFAMAFENFANDWAFVEE